MKIYEYPYTSKELDEIKGVLDTLRSGGVSNCPFDSISSEETMNSLEYCHFRCGSIIPDWPWPQPPKPIRDWWEWICPCTMAEKRVLLTKDSLERILVMVLRQHGRKVDEHL